MHFTPRLTESDNARLLDQMIEETFKIMMLASVQNIKRIIINLGCLNPDELSTVTQNRLINGLMLWTHYGGPWFPPREIR